jgi:hypothetical protein
MTSPPSTSATVKKKSQNKEAHCTFSSHPTIVGFVGGLFPGTGKMAAMQEIDNSVEEVCKQVGASNLAVQCVASFRTAV